MVNYTSGVSVLLCSYNGADRIKETLHHLAKQLVSPDIPWEIILIDNASTDNLQEVAASEWKALHSDIPFSIILEKTPGKDNAIDTGLRISHYSYAIICDDDNWLASDYISKAYLLMKNNSQIGMAGGQGIPVFESTPPTWFDNYKNYFAVGEQNKTPGEVTTSKGFLWGAGAIINKEAYMTLKEAGYQRIITYKNYPKVARGEDVEFCLAIKLAGYKIWYDDTLHYQHYISSDKLKWDYLIKLTKEGSIAGPLIRPYQEIIQSKLLLVANRNHWFRFLFKRNKRLADIKNAIELLLSKNREGDTLYQRKLANHYYFLGLLELGSDYNRLYKQVISLHQSLNKKHR